MIFAEVLDRRGRVRARVRVAELPFRIGRGYDCDLILDDPHVSPLHAVVERDAEGRIWLRDAGSRNGVHVEGSRGRSEAVALRGEVSVRLGRTLLRLRAADFAVPEALPIVERSAPAQWLLEHWSAALVVPAFCTALLLLEEFRRSTSPFEPLQALSSVAWGLLIYLAWVGCWALLNRLLRHRSRWVAHSTVAFLSAGLYTLVEWGFEWLRFFLEPIEPLQIADQVVSTGILGLTLLAHLTVMGVASRSLRLAVVGLGFAAILGLQLLDRYDGQTDWVETLPYWSRLEPVDPSWLPVESADAFFAHIPNLEAELEQLAEEALEEERDDAEAQGAPGDNGEAPELEPEPVQKIE